jgi:hypothetical protein
MYVYLRISVCYVDPQRGVLKSDRIRQVYGGSMQGPSHAPDVGGAGRIFLRGVFQCRLTESTSTTSSHDLDHGQTRDNILSTGILRFLYEKNAYNNLIVPVKTTKQQQN